MQKDKDTKACSMCAYCLTKFNFASGAIEYYCRRKIAVLEKGHLRRILSSDREQKIFRVKYDMWCDYYKSEDNIKK
jgi:hypothetical protein